ncbi:hypothetical protein I4641_07575 [Waterburya agarophytonicola K14]|uniref:EcsC family protein n=1 Tax=Waterburya agarophytonicola KI4 TaxID=2874699 RepID=A0A964BRG7_9CYAN|nr:hypothetical protein [Waterburya agarophytonicola]MCC0176836.1 hypothetical protein [Waterburya agarophytonicola KI4]
MPQTNTSENFLTQIIDTVGSLTETLTTQTQKILEQTTVSTGETLAWIASNPILSSADKILGLDWLMTFLGQADVAKIEANVAKMRSQYPQETSNQIAHRLIVQKTWSGGRLGLLTNIIPPIAALFLGIELIATTKLQTEMVYEIASAYGLDLQDPARRGEVLAIFGLSLGADVLKTGLTVVEIIPGIGAVVGASTNAAMLYVLGQTACRFYERKSSNIELAFIQQETDTDWQLALNQSKVMDRILAQMVRVSYPQQDWKEILPKIQEISPASVGTIAENLTSSHDLEALLDELIPEFAPLTLNRCYEIAISNGNITLEEQEILSQLAVKFDLDMSTLNGEQY